GALWLGNARVGNDIYLVDEQVRNDSGPAVQADGLHVDGAIVLLRAKVFGAGPDGALWLLGVRLSGLRIVESEVCNESGPALFANQLHAQGILRLEETQLSGAGEYATVRLAGASAGGQFSLTDTTITNPSGPLLDVNNFSYASMSVDWRH